MVELKNISKRFGDKIVYENFSCSFSGVTAVMGPSGCGKTTLLNIVAGLTDFEGEVLSPAARPAFMFQQPRLVPCLTALENLTFIGADRARAKEMLEKVEVDGALYPDELSGGMATRVALARAFLFESAVMLLDEPFTGLDLGVKKRIMDLFKELLKQHTKDVIIATHDIFDALYMSQRVLIIGKGQIVFETASDETAQHKLTQVLAAM